MKLGDFKDRYKGHRVFFIGNGPSIKETPLEKLKDQYCFGTNRVIQLYEHTSWRPTHYIAVTGENCRLADWYLDMVKVIDTGIPCFLPRQYYLGQTGDWFYPPMRHNTMLLNLIKYYDNDGKPIPGWSTDVEDRIIQTTSVSTSFLQLAAWMGFNPIYLLGCDLNYKAFDGGKDPNHWKDDYEKERTQEAADRDNNNMQMAHKEIRKITAQLGIEIYNATIGGSLEAYPRRDIYKVLNG